MTKEEQAQAQAQAAATQQEIQDIISSLTRQRDGALNLVAQLEARVMRLTREVEEIKGVPAPAPEVAKKNGK